MNVELLSTTGFGDRGGCVVQRECSRTLCGSTAKATARAAVGTQAAHAQAWALAVASLDPT